MEIEAQEQFELERLDNLLRIFEKVELAAKDGYMFASEVQDLRFECGISTKKEAQHGARS